MIIKPQTINGFMAPDCWNVCFFLELKLWELNENHISELAKARLFNKVSHLSRFFDWHQTGIYYVINF